MELHSQNTELLAAVEIDKIFWHMVDLNGTATRNWVFTC